ncbi:MAG: hypothetical protein HYT65_03360 [Candidatus Yanofskybacteria bacterium]|nr:hypothetical protein [Candidatus Yanofskybacteria bacterium]
MITAIILIAIISGTFIILNWFLPFKICPICAGVSGSWLILTAGIVFGQWPGDYKLPIAMLMGGTVVGIAFQGEAKFGWAKKSIYTWKAPVIIFGMPVAFWLLKNMSPTIFVAEVISSVLLIYVFFIKSSRSGDRVDSGHVTELEKKMKNCC